MGANDVANSMATTVSSRVVSLRQAVVIAAVFDVRRRLLFLKKKKILSLIYYFSGLISRICLLRRSCWVRMLTQTLTYQYRAPADGGRAGARLAGHENHRLQDHRCGPVSRLPGRVFAGAYVCRTRNRTLCGISDSIWAAHQHVTRHCRRSRRLLARPDAARPENVARTGSISLQTWLGQPSCPRDDSPPAFCFFDVYRS